jgi:hypothetical protein
MIQLRELRIAFNLAAGDTGLLFYVHAQQHIIEAGSSRNVKYNIICVDKSLW